MNKPKRNDGPLDPSDYLAGHPIIKAMKTTTEITLDDLLARKIYIVPSEQPVIQAEYWPLSYSHDIDEGEYHRIKTGMSNHGRLIQDAALLVWSVSDTPRTNEQRQQARLRIVEATHYMGERVSRTCGQNGGTSPKRREWADVVAERLRDIAPTATRENAWELMPESGDPWGIETDAHVWEIYRDGDKLVARSTTTGKETALKKSTFFKNYYAKGK